MWHEVLRRLPQAEGIALVERRSWRRPDVLLADGHAPVPDGPRPLVAQVHEASWRDPELRALLEPEFANTLDRHVAATAARASYVLTASESARQEITEAYDIDPARVRVAPHGVHLDVFHPDAGKDDPAVAGSLPRDFVLFVGTVHPRKNLPVLREAMVRLAADGSPHALVLVVAPAPDRADSSALLAEATAELRGFPGRVHVRRAPDDRALATLMRHAAALCLPSASEGFGLPVLEAMACGTPVVVADRGALPEVTGDGGVAVEPSVDTVASALADVLDDDGSLGGRARRRAEGFTWERTTSIWATALHDARETHPG
jgi:alpha-1,3-rhamnosyl/mannosyltransferase